jgi:sulfate adenylyltransferase subunit 1
MTLEDDIDVGRGDMIARKDNLPSTAQNFDAMICWMSELPMTFRKKYILKHNSTEVTCMLTNLVYKLDVNTFSRDKSDDLKIELNDICRASLKTSKPVCYDDYDTNRANGSFILIDQQTNETVAAGMMK